MPRRRTSPSAAQVSSAEAALSAAQQALAVAQATYEQYQALSAYTRITAPYAGVVTIRYADTGSLIAAGTSESKQAEPVVRLAQISVLRLVLPIPESMAGTIRLGDPIKVHVEALNRGYRRESNEVCGRVERRNPNDAHGNRFSESGWEIVAGNVCNRDRAGVQEANVLTLPVEAVEMKDNSEGTVCW